MRYEYIPTMLYDSLKILHVISAALLLTSMGYCCHLWRRAQQTKTLAIAANRIQVQTWLIILPMIIFQLGTGFTMISLKHEDFSQLWIIGSVIGFIVVIVSWFSFIYLLVFSQQLIVKSQHVMPTKFKLFRHLQSILLLFSATALFAMIFLMTNKIH